MSRAYSISIWLAVTTDKIAEKQRVPNIVGIYVERWRRNPIL